jgi:hypothetical protein
MLFNVALGKICCIVVSVVCAETEFAVAIAWEIIDLKYIHN